MKQSQIDYINFYYLLKGNYRKGVHALRSILADGGQAKAFAENPSAVAVVLSYDKENPDKNSEELYNLLINSNVSDLASGTYICSTYGVTSFEELAADEEIMAEVAADESSMNAIVASESAMYTMATSEVAMNSIAGNDIALTTILSSEIAINAISKSETALVAIASSEKAMNAVSSNETIMNAIAASNSATLASASNDGATSVVASNQAIMQSIAASRDAMDIIVESESKMTTIASTEVAMSEIATSSVAMSAISSNSTSATIVAANSTAMTKIAESETAYTSMIESDIAWSIMLASSTAMTAIAESQNALSLIASDIGTIEDVEASTIAKNALVNSSLVEKLSGMEPIVAGEKNSYNVWTEKNFHEGMAYVISVKCTLDDESSNTLRISTRATTGTYYTVGTVKDILDTTVNVEAFFTNPVIHIPESYTTWGGGCDVCYIPIS